MTKHSRWFGGLLTAGAAVLSAGAMAAEGKGSIYGDIRWSLSHSDLVGVDPAYTADNNVSHYGIRGAVTEGSLTAFGAYERTLDNDGAGGDVTRQGYAGLKSDYGTVKYGQFGTAYFEAGRKRDPFYNTAVAGAGAAGIFNTNSHGLSAALTAEGLGAGFLDNQVAYATPSWGGFSANVAWFVDETAGNQNHDYGGGIEYRNDAITLGVQALDVNATGNFGVGALGKAEAQRVYGSFGTTEYGIGASAEMIDLPAAAADQNYYFLSGWVGVAERTRLAVAAGHEEDTGAEGDSVTLGVFHDVVQNFTIWTAARRFDGTKTASGVVNDVITVGASFKFNLGFD